MQHSDFLQGSLRAILRSLILSIWYLASLPTASDAAENCETGYVPVGTTQAVKCTNEHGVSHNATSECVGTPGGCCSKFEMIAVARKACWDQHGEIAIVVPEKLLDGRFGLDWLVGTASLSGFDDQRFFAVLSPRFLVHQGRNTRLSFTIPILIATGTYSLDSLGIAESVLGEGNNEVLPEQAALRSLRVGPTWGLVPSAELTFGAFSKFQTSVFAGAGFRYQPGDTVTRNGVRSSISSSTELLLSYGFALNYRLSRRTALRFEARAMSVLGEDRAVHAGNESLPFLESDTDTGLALSIGTSFSF